MKIRISQQVCNKLPGIQVAVIVLKDIQNLRKISTADMLLRGACAQCKSEWKDETKFKAVSQLIEQTQVEDLILPESQLLDGIVRKIKRGKPPEGKNNIHTLLHYFSIKHLVPLYGCDLDEVATDIEIDFTTPKKGKKPADILTTRETTNVIAWIIDVGSQPKEEFAKLPEEFIQTIQKYCGGKEAELQILSCGAPEADLNYVSEKEQEYVASNPESPSGGPESQAEKAPVPATPTQTEAQPTISMPSETPDKNPTPVPLMNAPLSIKEKIAEGVAEGLKALGIADIPEVEIETPADPSHGDYSTNIALKLGKMLQKDSQEVAQELINALPPLDFIQKTYIAGPGFINFQLSSNHLKGELDKIVSSKENYGQLTLGEGKKVLIEYSAPNIAKPLGVHHLLSTIIGQAIADLHRQAGYETVSLNYLGDWGTQYGKLLYAYKNWGDKEIVKADPLNELLKLYVRFHEESEKNPSVEDKGREEFKKLEEGDEENRKLWEWMRSMSVEALEQIYKKLGVTFDEYLGEAMYSDASKEILVEGKNKGIFVEGEKGAFIVQFEGDKYPPYMIQKGDGTTLYSTRDIASIRDRLKRYSPNKIVYVVDVAQKLHFNQLFETARKMGLTSAELVHVDFGRMQLPEGKMSTRKGDVILLEEVIREAIARTEKIVEEKSRELSEEEQKSLAEAMAIGAIKYNIFSQNRETNITFDWDRMLSLEGNSAPYLQYAYARAQSILRKAHENIAQDETAEQSDQTSLFTVENEKKTEQEKDLQPFEHKTEQVLLHLLPRFSEKIEMAVRDYKPNTVTTYLYDVARAFSGFYNEVHVLSASKSELREARLKLVEATAQILKNGLNLLGIEVFEQM